MKQESERRPLTKSDEKLTSYYKLPHRALLALVSMAEEAGNERMRVVWQRNYLRVATRRKAAV